MRKTYEDLIKIVRKRIAWTYVRDICLSILTLISSGILAMYFAVDLYPDYRTIYRYALIVGWILVPIFAISLIMEYGDRERYMLNDLKRILIDEYKEYLNAIKRHIDNIRDVAG